MNDTGVIDTFLAVFTRYIDSGFGLVGGEIGFLSTTLIAIDVTIAGLFWAWGADEDVLRRLVRKTLYIGVFAFIIGNFRTLADIVFRSFAGLGLKAGGGTLTMEAFMKPGSIAAAGLDAGRPLIEATAELMGFAAFFANVVTIAVLLLAWLMVVIAFFVLAVQVFVTLIEFKLVTLAGFVLLPFAFFGKTAFMAERVLGHVVSSGIKVLVLAVITGIGTGLFDRFAWPAGAESPTLEQSMSLALASLALLGLGIFGPGIANGIVSGGPQLGAGSAAGTALAAGGVLAGGAAAAGMAAGAAGGAIAGAATGGAKLAGSTAAGYSSGAAGHSGAAAVAHGVGGVGKAAGNAALSPLRRAADAVKRNFAEGRSGGTPSNETASAGGQPAWAAAMKRRQAIGHGASVAAHTLRSGDGGGAGASVDTSDKERRCSDAHPSATAPRPSRSRRTSAPRRSGTTGSARHGCRREAGGSPSSGR